MNNRAKATLAGLLGIGVFLAAGAASCGGNGNASGTNEEQSASNAISTTMNQNEPAPIFDHSDIRATGIEIEAIEALGENTTSFAITNTGHLLWSCPSLGEPFHADDEITNPTQVYNDTGNNSPQGGAAVPIGNMDPNGIYPGPNTGTYVLCVDRTGVPYAHYAEEDVDVVSGPATWDESTGEVVTTGAPTMPSCSTSNAGTKQAKTVCTK